MHNKGNFVLFKFPKSKILETSIFRLYEAIIIIFSVSLPMVSFVKEILIQPPGEPREQHLGDVRPKKLELHKIS